MLQRIKREARRATASVFALTLVAAFVAGPATAEPSHGFSPVHELKYGPGFTHFDYANPNAPKGGRLRLGASGTFDSLNPLRYPGRVPSQVRSLVFDTLLVRSADELAGYYGLLAETVEVSADRRSVRFALRDEARWRDGEPVTAEDVAFTFETLREQGAPFYRQALRHYSVAVGGPREITFRARGDARRDMVRILGNLPIHPEHAWQERAPSDRGMTPPLGSGPYRVETVNPGQSLTLEAFRAGDFDLRREETAAQWARGYEGPALRNGRIAREVVETKTAGTLTTLVFNLRRAPFDDIRVRRAISLAYDFDWINTNLMYDQQAPVTSFFGETDYAARGAASKEERELLAPVADTLPEGVMDTPGPGVRAGIETRRAALAKADRLLRDAGFAVVDGERVNEETGKPLTIDLLNYDPSLNRILGPLARNLEQLGVRFNYGLVDPATGTRRTLDHDFDMAVLRWSPRAVPGNAESLLWDSALADRKGTYALAGAKDPALDTALAAMVSARRLPALRTAARAFDRVLRWRNYAIGLWRKDAIWLAYWTKFGRPARTPGYAPSFIDLWWAKTPSRESRAESQR